MPCFSALPLCLSWLINACIWLLFLVLSNTSIQTFTAWYQSFRVHQWHSLKQTTPSNPSNNQSTQPGSSSGDEPSSIPYFLSYSENLGSILVTQPLLGTKNNYHSWSRAMVLALTAKKKIDFVNGKFPMPDLDSPLYEDWFSLRWSILCTLMFLLASCTVKLQEKCGLNWRIVSLG